MTYYTFNRDTVFIGRARASIYGAEDGINDGGHYVLLLQVGQAQEDHCVNKGRRILSETTK